MFKLVKKYTFSIFLVWGLLMLSACGGSSGPNTGKDVIGTWVVCRYDTSITASDFKEVLTLNGVGTTGYYDIYNYSSTDASCSAGESLGSSDTLTYTLGNAVATTLSGANVNATELDAVFTSMGTQYSIVYVDTTTTPNTLYLGDSTADPGLDGSTAAKRPTALQETVPRLKQ